MLLTDAMLPPNSGESEFTQKLAEITRRLLREEALLVEIFLVRQDADPTTQTLIQYPPSLSVTPGEHHFTRLYCLAPQEGRPNPLTRGQAKHLYPWTEFTWTLLVPKGYPCSSSNPTL